MAADRPGVVEIAWMTNPFRGDKFEEVWEPACELALRFGAKSWALLRSRDEPALFRQLAFFNSHLEFERYWNSEEMAEARIRASGYYQLPVVPHWNDEIGAGVLREAEEGAGAGV